MLNFQPQREKSRVYNGSVSTPDLLDSPNLCWLPAAIRPLQGTVHAGVRSRDRSELAPRCLSQAAACRGLNLPAVWSSIAAWLAYWQLAETQQEEGKNSDAKSCVDTALLLHRDSHRPPLSWSPTYSSQEEGRRGGGAEKENKLSPCHWPVAIFDPFTGRSFHSVFLTFPVSCPPSALCNRQWKVFLRSSL